jgi:hypothetical protein
MSFIMNNHDRSQFCHQRFAQFDLISGDPLSDGTWRNSVVLVDTGLTKMWSMGKQRKARLRRYPDNCPDVPCKNWASGRVFGHSNRHVAWWNDSCWEASTRKGTTNQSIRTSSIIVDNIHTASCLYRICNERRGTGILSSITTRIEREGQPDFDNGTMSGHCITNPNSSTWAFFDRQTNWTIRKERKWRKPSWRKQNK